MGDLLCGWVGSTSKSSLAKGELSHSLPCLPSPPLSEKGDCMTIIAAKQTEMHPIYIHQILHHEKIIIDFSERTLQMCAQESRKQK